MVKWMTMKELAGRVGTTIGAISKALRTGKIAGTRWKGRVFFNEEQVEYAERLYARSSRRGFKPKKGGKNDGQGNRDEGERKYGID